MKKSVLKSFSLPNTVGVSLLTGEEVVISGCPKKVYKYGTGVERGRLLVDMHKKYDLCRWELMGLSNDDFSWSRFMKIWFKKVFLEKVRVKAYCCGMDGSVLDEEEYGAESLEKTCIWVYVNSEWWWVTELHSEKCVCLCCRGVFDTFFKLCEHVHRVDTDVIVEYGKECVICMEMLTMDHIKEKHMQCWLQREFIKGKIKKQLSLGELRCFSVESYENIIKDQKTFANNDKLVTLIAGFDVEAACVSDPEIVLQQQYEQTKMKWNKEEVLEDKHMSDMFVTMLQVSIGSLKSMQGWPVNESVQDVDNFERLFKVRAERAFRLNGFDVFDDPDDMFQKDAVLNAVFNTNPDMFLGCAKTTDDILNKFVKAILYLFANVDCKYDKCVHLIFGAHNGSRFDFVWLHRVLMANSYIRDVMRVILFRQRFHQINFPPLKCFRGTGYVRRNKFDKYKKNGCHCRITFCDTILYLQGGLGALSRQFRLGTVEHLGKLEVDHLRYQKLYVQDYDKKDLLSLRDVPNEVRELTIEWAKLYSYMFTEVNYLTVFVLYGIEDACIVRRLMLLIAKIMQEIWNALFIQVPNVPRCFTPFKASSMAALAYRFWALTVVLKDQNVYIPQAKCGELIFSCLVGGRSDCLIQGSVYQNEGINFGQGSYNQLDICGMYANVQLSGIYPKGKPQMATENVLEKVNEVFAMKGTDMTVEDLNACGVGPFFGCWCLYWPEEGMLYLTSIGVKANRMIVTYDRDGDDVDVSNTVWNNLECQMHMSSVLAIAIARLGWRVKVVRVTELDLGVHFPEGTCHAMKDFIQFTLQKKEEAAKMGNDDLKAGYKLLANSLFGRTILMPTYGQSQFVNKEGLDKILKESEQQRLQINDCVEISADYFKITTEQSEPEYSSPMQYGVTTLDGSKAMYLEFVSQNDFFRGLISPEQRAPVMFYGDTDSKYLSNRSISISAKAEVLVLGGGGEVDEAMQIPRCKYETKDPDGKGAMAVFVKKKEYFCGDVQGNALNVVAKGQNLKQLTVDDFWLTVANDIDMKIPHTHRMSFSRRALSLQMVSLARKMTLYPLIAEANAFSQCIDNRPVDDVLSFVPGPIFSKSGEVIVHATQKAAPVLMTPLSRFEHILRTLQFVPKHIYCLDFIPLHYLENRVYRCLCDDVDEYFMIDVILHFAKTVPIHHPRQSVSKQLLTETRVLRICKNHGCRWKRRSDYYSSSFSGNDGK